MLVVQVSWTVTTWVEPVVFAIVLSPFVTAWGQTNRLLAGPFQSEAAANSFIAQLRRADVDGAFVWTSPAGQVVDALQASSARR